MGNISNIEDANWGVGQKRVDIIKPLSESSVCTQAQISEAADALKLSERYIYRPIRNYRESHGILTSLISQKPNGGKDRVRLSQDQQSLIDKVIDKFYLNNPKLKPAKIIEEICKQSFETNTIALSEATIRRRINNIPSIELRKRGENNSSTEPTTVSSPNAQYPLSIV